VARDTLAVVQSNELAQFDPGTGEVLDPVPASALLDPERAAEVASRAPDEDLAEWLAKARDFTGEINAGKATVSRELHGRMDVDAEWTRETDRYKISGESPDRIEYDVDVLRKVLNRLVRAGRISRAAAKKAVKKLLKLGPDVAEAIAEAETPKIGERQIRLSPKRKDG
jgi:hypothetical protein